MVVVEGVVLNEAVGEEYLVLMEIGQSSDEGGGCGG